MPTKRRPAPKLRFSARAASAVVALIVATLAPLAPSRASAPPMACRSLDSLAAAFQLIDYNDPATRARLKIVEDYHFNDDVRALRKGQSSSVASDLDFVLRAVPNHYDALSLMGRWQVANGPPRSSDGGAEAAECYFKRAIQFRPTDARLHLVYGVFLHQTKRLDDAEREYGQVEALGGGDAELYYNLGLLMIDRGQISKAREYADKAYALGYPLPGLRNKLRKYPEK